MYCICYEGEDGMCNMAGYVGERKAAPILIDMLRAQEALNGGYYTGIATIYEGKIYYRKLRSSSTDCMFQYF